MPKAITYIDLFSGIGGFREGLSRAGGFACIGHCEIDKYADQSYQALFDTEGEWFCEDIRKADPKEMPDFDLLCGGFPCQSFQFLEGGADSKTREVRCSLKLPGWLQKKGLHICCLKMFPDCLTMTGAGRLRPSSIRWTDWGMVWNGRCLTARISVSPSPAAGCTLSDILTSDAGEKYFLSPEQQKHLLCKSFPELRARESTPRKA